MLHRGAERVDAVLKFLAEEAHSMLRAAGAGAAARLLIVFCLAIHWVACLWYGLAHSRKGPGSTLKDGAACWRMT